LANLYSYSSGEARNEHDSPEYNSAAAVKAFGRTALAAALAYAAYTFWLIGRMFWFLHYSMTSAIRIDELAMMEEIRLFREGKYGIGYLWATYWGHRLLIPRLLMIADERFLHFSNTPLVVAGVFAQTLTTVRRRRGAALSARPEEPYREDQRHAARGWAIAGACACGTICGLSMGTGVLLGRVLRFAGAPEMVTSTCCKLGSARLSSGLSTPFS